MAAAWKKQYKDKLRSFEEVAKEIRSNDFISVAIGVGGCSSEMFEAILDRHEKLQNVKIMDAIQLRPTRLYNPEFMKGLDGQINYAPGFGIQTIRKSYADNCDFMVNTVLDAGDKCGRRSDVYITMVTPPNKHGYLNLSLTNDYTLEALRIGKSTGKLRVAVGEVNDQMPVVYGDNWVHVSQFDCLVEHSSPVPEFTRNAPSELEQTIAQYVLELIEDGDNIQMGIGGIPEAVVSGLEGKYDLGVTSEMFPIGLPKLVEEGIITNRRKPLHKGVSIGTFCMGDNTMYKYVAENPACEIYPSAYTNNPAFIARHPKMVAMNMALLVDFSGQITAEGLGHRMISGPGGQLDFAIGSYWSEGGKGITLMRSARKRPDGSLVSAIVPELPAGTPVTVPRTYAHYIVTEYGIADLRYKTRQERANALIAISHPDLRGELRKSMNKNFFPKWAVEQ